MTEGGFDTVLPADSIEFCPHSTAQDFLVCGTYKLHETVSSEKIEEEGHTVSLSRQQRTGKCLLLRVDADTNESLWVSNSGCIFLYISDMPSYSTLLQEVDLPAILDMKW